MRKLAMTALAVAVSIPAVSVVGSKNASAGWRRQPVYVAAPYCCRPRVYGYWQPRARVYGPIYAKDPLGWYGPIYAPWTYGWWGRTWLIDRCDYRC